MSVNKATLLGNVCADPKVTTFQEGGKIAQFRLATNKRGYTARDGREVPERTEFHNIVLYYSGLADVAEKYVKKGNKVYIEGEIRTREYKGEDNVTRYITEIYATELELLTPKSNGAPVPPPEPF